MADGTTLVDLEDSRAAVSSPEEDNSPTTSSPHKLISDCSDLYDLINFHPSATTQLHDDDDEPEPEPEPKKDTIVQKSWSSSADQPKQCFTMRHHRKSNSSSSSSSNDSDGPDSDSGTYARSNGHRLDDDGSNHLRESSESAVETSPEEKAGNTTATTSSIEGSFSPVYTPEPTNGFVTQETVVVHQQVITTVTATTTVSQYDDTKPLEPLCEDVDEPQPPMSIVDVSDGFDVVALESSLVHDNPPPLPSVVCPDDDDLRPESSSASSDASSPVIEHASVVSDVTNESEVEHPYRHQQMTMGKWLAEEEDDVRSPEDLLAAEDVDNKSFANGLRDDQHDGSSVVWTNHQQVQSQVVSVTQLISHGNDVTTTNQSSSDSDSDVDNDQYHGKKGKKKSAANKKMVTESSTVITSSSTVSKMKSAPGGPSTDTVVEQKKSTTTTTTSSTASSLATSEIDAADNVTENVTKSSFNSSESVRQNNDFDEIEGVKIDRAKVTRNFSQTSADEKAVVCRICGKQAFHMERIKAEKSVFHKSCFRCQECSKSLSVDTYCSHEGVLYCRPHFRQLFQPKAKFEEETISFPRRRHEMIIKENTPAELPPDVVRSADKPDYGLNEIPSLKNIKSRFEHGDEENHDGTNGSTTTVHVKRSESIASRLAKFKSLESAENGHANGNHDSDDSSNSSSSDEDEDRDPQVVRETRKKERTHEIPIDVTQEEVMFSGMSDLKTQWESVGTSPTKEERAREIQDDLAKLRLRMCHGKGSLKAKYESACEESVKAPARSVQSIIGVNGEIHANSLKEKFEKGELMNEEEFEKVEKFLKEKEDDLSVFKEQGTAADARHLFKEIDRSASSAHLSMSTSPTSNVKRSPSMRSREILGGTTQTQTVDGDIIRSSDKIDDDIMTPVDLSAKFKFFENYQDNQGTMDKKRFTITPPRDPVKEESPEPQSAHDPNIVRACDRDDDIVVVTDTAKKMLDKFRQMESLAERDESSSIQMGPKKPMKRITPPREYTKEDDGNDDYSSLEPDVSRNPDIVRCCDKIEDEFLVMSSSRKAKNLKEKFERWDEVDNSSSDRNYVDNENRKNNVVEDELLLQQQPCPDTAKNLKAKFEAIREESIRSQEIPKPKVNRFI